MVGVWWKAAGLILTLLFSLCLRLPPSFCSPFADFEDLFDDDDLQ